MRRFRPSVEVFEPRVVPRPRIRVERQSYQPLPDTLHTQLAADKLISLGDRPVQMTTPAMSSPRAFYDLADEVLAISHGQPIGLLGFSSGGGLALRARRRS